MTRRDGAAWLPGLPLAGLALAILAIDTIFIVSSRGRPPMHLALYGGGPAIFSMLLLVLSFRVSDRGFSERTGLTVWVWAIAFGFIAGGAAAYLGSLMALGDDPISRVWLLLLNSIALGAGVGAPLGYYYQEFRRVKETAETNAATNHRLNQRLQVANRVLRHNLRNELTLIRGHLEFYADEPFSADDDLAVIDDSLSRLLEFSRKAERMERIWSDDVDERSFDIDTVVTDIAETLPADRDTTVEVDLPSTDLVAYCHPFFPVALRETIENSLVHTNCERISVCASATADTIDLTVTDDGPGIPAEELEALAATHETDLTHGSGLGLWFVKWVTEYSRGSVTFETGPSTGTVVSFELPKDPPAEKPTLPVLGG